MQTNHAIESKDGVVTLEMIVKEILKSRGKTEDDMVAVFEATKSEVSLVGEEVEPGSRFFLLYTDGTYGLIVIESPLQQATTH